MDMTKSMISIFYQGAIPPDFVSRIIAGYTGNGAAGGYGIFLGQVRADDLDGRIVAAIDFTAYETMAETQAAKILEEITAEFEVFDLHIWQSLGTVAVGDICLFAIAVSAHRHAAQQACAKVVERLKAELPIWGKEIFGDDSHQWKKNK